MFSFSPTPSTKELLKRVGWYLLLMQVTRILFYFFNQNSFQHYSFLNFVGGVWFDLITFCLIGSIYIFFVSLPFKFKTQRIYQLATRIIFNILLMSCLALNLVDVEYFKHSNKRSNIDLFAIMSKGSDFKQQIIPFLRDFWFLFVFLFLFLVLIIFIERKGFKYPKFASYRAEILQFILIAATTIIIGRGGFGLRPVNASGASYFTTGDEVGLVLNTPFTVVKSYGKSLLYVPNYFQENKLKTIFNPIQTSQPQNLYHQRKNVVILLLESFGSEFVGFTGAPESYTPFLDSLAGKSLAFKFGIANGKRSIEAIPSILNSIPSWMDEAYITSPYGNNQTQSLPEILNENGYETAFFHGATNGSMNFDVYTNQIGVQHYFGRTEYGNDADFDGTWGIDDEHFLKWSADKMTTFKKPFFSLIFTLSSHHPFYIPPKWRGKLKKGPAPIMETINYSDECLREFFAKAEKQAWFKNTIFIISADHNPAPESDKYGSAPEIFHIPIMIYDPEGKIKPQLSNEYFQQIDIFPTILDLLNIKTKFYAFGTSYFKNPNEGMSFLNGNYYYFYQNYNLLFHNDKAIQLFNLKESNYPYADSLANYRNHLQEQTNRIRAYIQTYNRDLSKNQTTVK